MTKQYYECHITLEDDPDKVKIACRDIGWKYSRIDGDPVLGKGLKCYATKHFNYKLDESVVLELLNNAADEMKLSGLKVTRRKVEKVLHDDRSSAVRLGQCNGACPECHLDDLEELNG
jgi:hypothetical protein